MTLSSHRLSHKQHESEFWSPKGAMISPGRWHHKNSAVIYTSESIAVAMLECEVHGGPLSKFADNHVAGIAEIPADLVLKIEDLISLPPDWREYPHPTSTRDIATFWFKDQTSCVLSVPSCLIANSRNFILNTTHKNYQEITLTDPYDFTPDPRLVED